ncbi:unnamed protein product [Symbiodinium natans]|uniref:NodB homology domain-containing protein n=1 Tax=Symbiodinium natans TaxID=878477 RepID=A0A812KAM8_9DINO|nr:unnamed protein product [Symbiodinium natans]
MSESASDAASPSRPSRPSMPGVAAVSAKQVVRGRRLFHEFQSAVNATSERVGAEGAKMWARSGEAWASVDSRLGLGAAVAGAAAAAEERLQLREKANCGNAAEFVQLSSIAELCTSTKSQLQKSPGDVAAVARLESARSPDSSHGQQHTMHLQRGCSLTIGTGGNGGNAGTLVLGQQFLNKLIIARGRQKEWREALAILAAFPEGLQADLVSYNGSIAASSKAQRWETGLGLFAGICEAGLSPDVVGLNACISSLGAVWPRALQLLSGLGLDVTPNTISRSAAINGLKKGHQWQRSLQLLRDMPRARLSANTIVASVALSACGVTALWAWAHWLFGALAVRADAVTCSTMLSACEKAGRWQLALDHLTATSRSKIRLDVVVYNACISACEKVAAWMAALRLFCSLEEAQLRRSIITFGAVISACEKAGHWQLALHLLGSMYAESVRPDVVCINACISAFEKGARWQMALYLLASSYQDGLEPTTTTYNACISACEKAGQSPLALRLLSSMPEAWISPDVISYNAAISACESGGQWQLALQLLSKVASKFIPSVISYNACISACEKGWQWQMALALLAAMLQEHILPNIISYSAAISSMEKVGNWQRACKLFGDLLQARLRPNVISYNATISSLAAGSQWQLALGLFATMDEVPTTISFTAVMGSLTATWQWQLALALFAAMPRSKVASGGWQFNCWRVQRVAAADRRFHLSAKAQELSQELQTFKGKADMQQGELLSRLNKALVKAATKMVSTRNFALALDPRALCYYDAADFPGVRGLVALTVDDAPCRQRDPQAAMLVEVKDLLEEFEAKATFFLCTDDVPGHEEGLAELVRAGNEVANHGCEDKPYGGYSEAQFRHAFLRAESVCEAVRALSQANARAEVAEAELEEAEALEAPDAHLPERQLQAEASAAEGYAGTSVPPAPTRASEVAKPRWFRAPHADISAAMQKVLTAEGFTHVLCDSFANDTQINDAAFISDSLLSMVDSTGGSIVVIHMPERGFREHNFEALRLLLSGLQQQNLRVVTLSEMSKAARQPLSTEHGKGSEG